MTIIEILARSGNRAALAVMDTYSPDQPRDEKGMWAGGDAHEHLVTATLTKFSPEATGLDPEYLPTREKASAKVKEFLTTTKQPTEEKFWKFIKRETGWFGHLPSGQQPAARGLERRPDVLSGRAHPGFRRGR